MSLGGCRGAGGTGKSSS